MTESGNLPAPNQQNTSILERLLRAVIIYAPWAWLLVFGVFVGLVTLQTGGLPSYGQPDPKMAGLASLLYIPTIALMLWTIASVPAAFVFVLLARVSGQLRSFTRHDILIYASGLAFFALIVLTDVAGLMTWLAD